MSGSRKVRIISDGTALNTRVLDALGDPIKWGASGLVKIEIMAIEPKGLVRAVLTVDHVGLDIDAAATMAKP